MSEYHGETGQIIFDDMSPKPMAMWYSKFIFFPKKCCFTGDRIPAFTDAYYTTVNCGEFAPDKKWTTETQYIFRKLKGEV